MIEDYKKRIDGLNMYYRIAGSPKSEPIIFLHGWGSRINPLPFTLYKGTTGVIEELANYFYVFAPELPGLLRSDAPKAVWNYEEFAKIIYILALSIGWEKSIIMGQSFGGGVATAFAKLYPDYTKALVIVDSVVSDLPMNSYWVLLYKWARLGHSSLESRRNSSRSKKLQTYYCRGWTPSLAYKT
ncbi:MAG: alpha/beta hydrolase [Candidatus Portnoybacteria bacterium]|nr:alpha/beta hydrolase [Candidatus Portnoybacteria bacterium]